MAARSGARLVWSLLAASVGWQLSGGGSPAYADGAFPDSQNILTPASLPNEILLGTNFGLVLSVDGGQTWTWTCEQTQNNFATHYQLGPPPKNRLFATSLVGFVFSDDNSCSWSMGAGIPAGSIVSDLFADPTNANRVLAVTAVTADAGVVYQVLESLDGGTSFGAQPLYAAQAGDTISGVEIARSMPATVYLTLTGGAAHTPKLVQSNDGGSSWQLHDLTAHLASGTNFVRLIAVDPGDPQRVLLRIRSLGDGGTAEGVAITEDGGATAKTPLTLPGGVLSAFTRMSDGTIVVGGVVGTTNVAYTSTDNGSTFKPVPGAQPAFRALSSRGGTLFVVADNAADQYAIGTSLDLGMTWHPLMGWGTSVLYPDLLQIQAIQTCVMATCQTDCQTRAAAGQWAPEMCSAIPAPLPVDAGIDAHPGGTGGAGHGGTGGAGRAGTDAATPPGGGKSSGCHCASSGATAPGLRQLGALAFALTLVFGRRRRRRR